MPTALKKPFDIAELFENKISALVAAGGIRAADRIGVRSVRLWG